jgi:iron only hydrogenase large subunit-like protein
MGAVIKHYFSQKINYHPNDMFMVSFMPCVRKQAESERKEGDTTGLGPDVDIVLTTNDLAKYLKESNIVVDENVPETNFDAPFGTGTGSALLFGRTGGVMIAALRYAYKVITGNELSDVQFEEKEGIKSAVIAMKPKDGGDPIKIKIGVIVGLGDVKKFIKNVLTGDEEANSYHFVEIMACAPLGCVGGGGQPPVGKNKSLVDTRKEMLNAIDTEANTKEASENTAIDVVYDEFFKSPCSQISHHLLHTKDH